MAWIEVHQSLPRHPKLAALAAASGYSRHEALGHLICLWLWALDHADADGRLPSTIDPKCLAISSDIEPRFHRHSTEIQVNLWRDALLISGFLSVSDGQYILHDWAEYTGRLSAIRTLSKEQRRVGGLNRMAAMTPEQRQYQARHAADARWSKHEMPAHLASPTPGEMPGEMPAHLAKMPATGPDPTGPDRTGPAAPPCSPPTPAAGITATTAAANQAVAGADPAAFAEAPARTISDDPAAGDSQDDVVLRQIAIAYERDIGLISPAVADQLKSIALEYSAEWFSDAVSEACGANVRRLNYVCAILDRWRVEGRGPREPGENANVAPKGKAADWRVRPRAHEIAVAARSQGQTISGAEAMSQAREQLSREQSP